MLSSTKKQYLKRFGDATLKLRVFDNKGKETQLKGLLPVKLNNKYEYTKRDHMKYIKGKHSFFYDMYVWDVSYTKKGITLACLDYKHLKNGEIDNPDGTTNKKYFFVYESERNYEVIYGLGSSIFGLKLRIEAIQSSNMTEGNYSIINVATGFDSYMTNKIRDYVARKYDWIERKPYTNKRTASFLDQFGGVFTKRRYGSKSKISA